MLCYNVTALEYSIEKNNCPRFCRMVNKITLNTAQISRHILACIIGNLVHHFHGSITPVLSFLCKTTFMHPNCRLRNYSTQKCFHLMASIIRETSRKCIWPTKVDIMVRIRMGWVKCDHHFDYWLKVWWKCMSIITPYCKVSFHDYLF